jgi:hypothetical protein
VIERLPNKNEALSSNPSTTKKKERKKRKGMGTTNIQLILTEGLGKEEIPFILLKKSILQNCSHRWTWEGISHSTIYKSQSLETTKVSINRELVKP